MFTITKYKPPAYIHLLCSFLPPQRSVSDMLLFFLACTVQPTKVALQQKNCLKFSKDKSVMISCNTQHLPAVIRSRVEGSTRNKWQWISFEFLENHQSPDLTTAEQETEKTPFTPGALASQVSELLGNMVFLLILLLLTVLFRTQFSGTMTKMVYALYNNGPKQVYL